MRVPWKSLLRALFVVLALVFLVLLVRSQWAALRVLQWQLEPGWAALALLGLEITWLFELNVWRYILRGVGGRLSPGRAAQIWFLSNIVRYVPGNVWQFLGMSEMAADDGIPRPATFTSILLHQAISTAAGIVLAALYFGLSGEATWSARLRPALLAAPLGLLLLQPRVLEMVLNWMLDRLKRPRLRVTLTWGQVWFLVGAYVVVWLGMGSSFAALVRAVSPVAGAHWPYLVASWAAAYVLGYLSLLTPSGLGVREGAIVLLLAAVVSQPVAAAVAILARLWMVAGELIGVAVAVLLRRRAGQGVRRPVDGPHA